MSKTYTIESEFVVPESMERENIEHVLERFYDDLRETDRFLDATVSPTEEIDPDERERLLTMVALLTEQDISYGIETVKSLDDRESFNRE